MRAVVFMLSIVSFTACTDSSYYEEDVEQQVYRQILEVIDSSYQGPLDSVDMYYVESAACLSCKEKFWNYFNRFGGQMIVLQQIEHTRIPLSAVIPDYVNSPFSITPVYSNRISKLLDKLQRSSSGVFKIYITNNRITDIQMFMK